MRYFDSHTRAEALTDEVLENLVFFGVRDVLVAAHGPRRFDNSDELLGYLEWLSQTEAHRLRLAGITPYVALGVHPDGVPRRTHHEVWRTLPGLLQDESVVAVGELALAEESAEAEKLLSRQLALAKEAGLPALVSSDSDERARGVRRILELVKEVGIPPGLVVVNHVDSTCVRPVLDAGCHAGVTVGPLHLGVEDAVDMLSKFGELGFARIILNSGLRAGPVDVLALPRAALRLAESGLPPSIIRRLVWGNASRLLTNA